MKGFKKFLALGAVPAASPYKSFACLAAGAALALGCSVMRADQVTFTGSASGSFNSSGSTTLEGLSYTGSTFSGKTAGTPNQVSFGGDPGTSGNTNNFGSISLSDTGMRDNYNGDTLNLVIDFSAPDGISTGQDADYTADLSGTITKSDNGSLVIDFNDPNGESFSFSNGTETGNFTLYVNNTSLSTDGPSTVSITGYIDSKATPVSVTPEPSSLLLLGTGMLGIGFMMRKRLA